MALLRAVRHSPTVRFTAKTLIVALLLFGAIQWTGFRIVPSQSIPRGLYVSTYEEMGLSWLLGGAGNEIERGDIIGGCPPAVPVVRLALERGYLHTGECESGTTLVGKPVVAIPGDYVRLDSTGLWVNGHLLEDSRAPLRDSKGRQLTPLYGTFDLEEGQYYLYSPFIPGRSFDSRYYGPVEEKVSERRPLLVEVEIPEMPFVRDSLGRPSLPN